MAVGHSVAPDRWQREFDELSGRAGGRFARVETRRTAAPMPVGTVSELPAKNCWTLAEHAGDRSPGPMQHLLASAVIDDDGLRDDLRDYVIEHRGDADATLVVDETGDLEKGVHTVGVRRPSTPAPPQDRKQPGRGLSHLRHSRRACSMLAICYRNSVPFLADGIDPIIDRVLPMTRARGVGRARVRRGVRQDCRNPLTPLSFRQPRCRSP